jgi:hypothetical protein
MVVVVMTSELWTVTSNCSCDEINTTIITLSHCWQFLSHHNYSLKSLFTALSHQTYNLKSMITVVISSQLHFEVNVHSFHFITTTVWSDCSQFYVITTTTLSHCSQLLSHHNYSLKSMFRIFISSQLLFEVNVHSVYVITTTTLSQCSQFLSHHKYSLKSLFNVLMSSHLQP